MAIVVPGTIWWTSGLRQVELPVVALWAAVVVGAALLAAGLSMLVWTNVLFDRHGKGTLAIFDPPRHLVVRGPYRHVRNPMITGVVGMLLGEAVLFRSLWLSLWALAFLAVNMLFLPLCEEPGLIRRFGAEYTSYRANVPRWLPRVRPWTGARE